MSAIRTPKIDPTNMTCFEHCKALYNAITALRAGTRKVQIRHGDYWVEYDRANPKNVEGLVTQYRELWGSCEEAQKALPSLSPGARAQRGGALPLKIYG